MEKSGTFYSGHDVLLNVFDYSSFKDKDLSYFNSKSPAEASVSHICIC